jgi:hypothetical protein
MFKLNNNKESAKWGCSSGASTAKSRKAKGSITTPSLGENKIFEEVAKQTGKTMRSNGNNQIKKIIMILTLVKS